MNVDIQSLGFPMTEALADHAGRRLRFVLPRHSDRIQRVVVRLGDENGPRGGLDKFCRIQVYLCNAPLAVIEATAPDLYTAIDRAVDRVGRVVVRHLERSRIGRRHGRDDATAAALKEFDAASRPTHPEGEQT